MKLAGKPSEQLPEVLATGETSVRFAFISMSARDPDGRDGDYIAWHSLDHRPEQYRLPELRDSTRLVSTPACRNARAASEAHFDKVDHVMTYLFTGAECMPAFTELGGALDRGGRMEHRLPSVGYMTAELAGKIAAPRAVAGADVIPWRPAKGVYLIVEKGASSPASLIDVPGVAGAWWYSGNDTPGEMDTNSTGLQITYCYLDDDPVAVAERLAPVMKERWASGEVQGLLAAPFHTIVPFDWSRNVPG